MVKHTSNERLVTAVAVFALATAGITGVSGLQTPSIQAFDDLSSVSTQTLDYFVTQQGYKVLLDNNQLKSVSEGVTLQTYFKNNFGVMIDQVPVDIVKLQEQYGFNYKVELNFAFHEDGFSIHPYVLVGTSKQPIAINEEIGVVVQIPANLFLQGENIQLVKEGARVDQLNDSGIIYAVLYSSGEYVMEHASKESGNKGTETNGIYAEVTNEAREEETTTPYVRGETENYVSQNLELEQKPKQVPKELKEEDVSEVVTVKEEAPAEDTVAMDYTTEKTQENEKVKYNTKAIEVLGSNLENLGVTEEDKKTNQEIAVSLKDLQVPVEVTPVVQVSKANLTEEPEEVTTRGNFATLVANTFNLKGLKSNVLPFEDIKDSTTALGVQAVYEKGYMFGTTDKTFSPEGYVTKQQLAVTLDRILKDNDVSVFDSTIIYQDFDKIANYAKPSVLNLTALNVLETNSETFNPQSFVSNKQVYNAVTAVAELLPVAVG